MLYRLNSEASPEAGQVRVQLIHFTVQAKVVQRLSYFAFQQQGHYMYIETSFASPGDKAILRSYRYFASSANCKMNLWYHMFGSGVGGLEVKLKLQDGTYQSLWQVYGGQGNIWKKATVGIGVRTQFEIMIQATRGSNWQGDVAIDDITFSNCFADVARNCSANEVCILSDVKTRRLAHTLQPRDSQSSQSASEKHNKKRKLDVLRAQRIMGFLNQRGQNL